MNMAEAAIRHPVVTIVLTIVVSVGGLWAYGQLGRLEDPEFTIKEAQVFTQYPGASAQQVADEVSDELETAIQQMGQLKLIRSLSTPGLSTIRVEVQDKYDKHSLPQVWDELRRKVNDAQSKLPPGTSTSIVNDDFGDVYGIFLAVYGDGFTYAELKKHADMLRRELLLVNDVAKVALYGEQKETVYVKVSRAKLAALGIPPEQIYALLSGENLVRPAGWVQVGADYIRIEPTGEFKSVEDIGNLLLSSNESTLTKLYVRDIADIERAYEDPPTTIMRYNGHPAIGLGVSTAQGGNVVNMGKALQVRLAQLQAQTPIGMEVGVISMQSESVVASINGFVISLIEAVVIVIGVLVLAMGFRSGILIGVILILTVFATFLGMYAGGIMLERISLGALIIALGMLVDNAIVIVEGMLVNMQRGMKGPQAAANIVSQTSWPLLGATTIAIVAFAAIGVSQDSTGEYCRSLFLVILISLLASWVFAVTVTPLFGVSFLRPKVAAGQVDPYGGIFFRGYRALLEFSLRFRWITVAVMAILMALAIYGFKFVDKSFFPDATRPQFMVHYWLPQGTYIRDTEAEVAEIEDHLRSLPSVKGVSSFVGRGALRFLLTYSPEDRNSAYALFLVDVDDFKSIDKLMPEIQTYLNDNYPNAMAFPRKFVLGPGEANKIQVRFRGPDPAVLRQLEAQTIDKLRRHPTATDVQSDWRQRVPLAVPVVAETQARNTGITRKDIAAALEMWFTGQQVGYYREGDELLPIVVRPPDDERRNIDATYDVPIWSRIARTTVPMRQVVNGLATESSNDIIWRRNRLPTLTVKCDPKPGLTASAVLDELRPKVQAAALPEGYSLEWGGEYEDSGDAQAALASKIPAFALLMVLITIVLFNSIGKPLVIFLAVPLIVIGVTAGLLMFDQPFGFMALLGFLSLVGLQIKNAIVLVDEVGAQTASGKDGYLSIVDSGVSRIRPVSMGALTTILGMIPLLADAFFVAMAVTIMIGLTFATVLTMIVVPVFYSIIFRIHAPAAKG